MMNCIFIAEVTQYRASRLGWSCTHSFSFCYHAQIGQPSQSGSSDRVADKVPLHTCDHPQQHTLILTSTTQRFTYLPIIYQRQDIPLPHHVLLP